jgi:8-oxo-dGTP pyrophosphatase MutT (NUDIX family)
MLMVNNMNSLCVLIESLQMETTLRDSVVSGYDNIFTPQDIGGAGLLIINNKSVLMGKRSSPDTFADHWCTFGGTVEDNENPLNTAKREVWEEAKIDSSKLDIQIPHVYIDETNDGFKFITYIAISDDEFEVELNNEHTDYGWFPLTNLPSPLHPGINRLLANPICMRRIMEIINRG